MFTLVLFAFSYSNINICLSTSRACHFSGLSTNYCMNYGWSDGVYYPKCPHMHSISLMECTSYQRGQCPYTATQCRYWHLSEHQGVVSVCKDITWRGRCTNRKIGLHSRTKKTQVKAYMHVQFLKKAIPYEDEFRHLKRFCKFLEECGKRQIHNSYHM